MSSAGLSFAVISSFIFFITDYLCVCACSVPVDEWNRFRRGSIFSASSSSLNQSKAFPLLPLRVLGDGYFFFLLAASTAICIYTAVGGGAPLIAILKRIALCEDQCSLLCTAYKMAWDWSAGATEPSATSRVTITTLIASRPLTWPMLCLSWSVMYRSTSLL